MSIGEEKKTRVNMKAKRYWGKAVSFPNKVEKERAIRLSPPPRSLILRCRRYEASNKISKFRFKYLISDLTGWIFCLSNIAVSYPSNITTCNSNTYIERVSFVSTDLDTYALLLL